MTSTTAPQPETPLFQHHRRVSTPTVLQMEAVECGAAALGMVLAYHKRYVPLEELRVTCGVSRDGSKASNILKAARYYGLTAKALRGRELADIETLRLPAIAFWNFNHYVVIEGTGRGGVYINDPASGARWVSLDEFDRSFTGVVFTFAPGAHFAPGGKRSTFYNGLLSRLRGLEPALLYVLLVSVALVVPGLAVPTFSQVFIDGYLVGGNDSWLLPLLGIMAATVGLTAVLTWLQANFLLRLETRLSLSTSARFVWHVLCLPLEFFTQRHAGDIAGRVAINDRVASLLSGELAIAVLNVLMIVFYAALLFRYDWLLTVIGIAVVLLNIAALRVVSRQRAESSQQVLQEQGKLFGAAASGLRTIETIKAVAGERDLFTRLTGYHARAARAEQKLAAYTYVLAIIPPTLIMMNTGLILALGSLRVIDGSMTVGMLVAFLGLMTAFTAPVTVLVNLGGLLQQTEGDMKRLDDVLNYAPDPFVKPPAARDDTDDANDSDTPPPTTSDDGGAPTTSDDTTAASNGNGTPPAVAPPAPPARHTPPDNGGTQPDNDPAVSALDLSFALPGGGGSRRRSTPSTITPTTPPRPAPIIRTGARLTGHLELRNVTFGYGHPDLSPPLLRDFSLYIEPGSRVALVGGSGSGKSTVARLVMGLYRPWSGSILFDGLPREEHDRRMLTGSLSFVDQQIFLFAGSVRDNLTLWDDAVPEAQIVQAARDAVIHDAIVARPGGYDSLITEGGANFSGGQRQRLEIARALVSNPTLLVLDEATSALDPATELEIDNNLRRRFCTLLIVAHRLSTIRDCDEIIVLKEGAIVQRGTHDDLLRERHHNHYAKLVGAETRRTNPQRAAISSSLDALMDGS